jgi:uncharacterized protein YidB (DUF937 family)
VKINELIFLVYFLMFSGISSIPLTYYRDGAVLLARLFLWALYFALSNFYITEGNTMGLFDQVAGSLLNGDAGKYQAILSWVEQQGGIQALLDKLRQGGLSEIVSSWLSSNGTNQSLSGDQITQALGSPSVAALGEKLGVDTGSASALLAEYLPKVIDALSPNGEVTPEAHNDLLSAGVNLLKGKLFS